MLENINEKLIGYFLLFAGVIIIIFSAFSVYSVFTGRARAAALFNFKGISLDASQLIGGDLPPEQRALVQQELAKNSQGLELELLPAEILNSTTNTIAHLFFMGFVASVGFRLAQIGAMLVRPIKVSVKGVADGGQK